MTIARDLQAAFDASFALPAASESASEVDFLAIRVAGDPYAIVVAELAGVFADRPITPAPSRSPALIGIAGVRSSIVPVFDLAAQLGYQRVLGTAARWIAMAGPVGFAFEALDGHARVAATAITSQAEAARPHSSEVVQVNGQLRPIIRLSSVVAAIGHKES